MVVRDPFKKDIKAEPEKKKILQSFSTVLYRIFEDGGMRDGHSSGIVQYNFIVMYPSKEKYKSLLVIYPQNRLIASCWFGL